MQKWSKKAEGLGKIKFANAYFYVLVYFVVNNDVVACSEK